MLRPRVARHDSLARALAEAATPYGVVRQTRQHARQILRVPLVEMAALLVIIATFSSRYVGLDRILHKMLQRRAEPSLIQP